MRLFVIFALVIAFLAILFALQNINLVTIQFFIWEYRQYLALVLLGTLAIGIVIGLLVSFPAIIRRNNNAARIQKQADTLTGLLQEKEEAVSKESRKTEAIKQNYEDLIKSLGLIEPVTGLLRNDLLHRVIATYVKLFLSESGEAQGQSLSVLIFKVQPRASGDYRPEDLFAAVARLLQRHTLASTWFYSDGKGVFTTILPGLDMKAATHYGEELQASILDNLLTMPTGQILEADVSVGGAISNPKAAVDAHKLVATAETALEQALERGRNRLRFLQA